MGIAKRESCGDTQNAVPIMPSQKNSPTLPAVGAFPASVRTAKPRPKAHDLHSVPLDGPLGYSESPSEQVLLHRSNGSRSGLSLSGDCLFSRESSLGAGARCRVRTCDFLRVKQALYH